MMALYTKLYIYIYTHTYRERVYNLNYVLKKEKVYEKRNPQL